MAETLNASLQANIITVLCHDDRNGKIVAAMVDPNLFEGEYRVIAERAMEYWRLHKEAPKIHTFDLVSEVLDDKQNRKRHTYLRILQSMQDLAPDVNVNYVVSQVSTFVRLQRTKDAIVKSAEQIQSQSESSLEQIEGIWNNLLRERTRAVAFDSGIRLRDIDRMLEHLAVNQAEFTSGIPYLDKMHVVPARKTFFMMMGAAGKGKSWFLVNVGKAAFMQRKKVLHISLEMSEEDVLTRYIQSILAITKREVSKDDPLSAIKFVIDRDAKNKYAQLEDMEEEDVEVDFSLADPHAREELVNHLSPFGLRVENIIIKSFSPRSLSAAALRAYLDDLEVTEGFVPDLLVLDSPYLMKTDVKNYRIELGRIVEDVRGICFERNIAGVGGHQITRKGAESALMSTTHIAEDWSIVATCDTICIFSATDFEFEKGLARLFVGKCRAEKDRFLVLLTQLFAIGQFCIESIPMANSYGKLLKQLPGWSDGKEKEDDADESDDK
jgi:hypothetical protein